MSFKAKCHFCYSIKKIYICIYMNETGNVCVDTFPVNVVELIKDVRPCVVEGS